MLATGISRNRSYSKNGLTYKPTPEDMLMWALYDNMPDDVHVHIEPVRFAIGNIKTKKEWMKLYDSIVHSDFDEISISL